MAENDQSSGKRDQREQTKDERLDKLLWFKISASVAFGVGFGVLNLTGFFVFVL